MSTTTPVRTLRPADLEPLGSRSTAPLLARPSLSYWQDAWIRLKANRRALVSLYIVVGLLLFAFVGPLIWRVDPALQDVDQVSVAPGADRSARVVEPLPPWDGVSVEAGYGDAAGLRLAAAATTRAVRLLWQEVPGVETYRVYRNHYSPEQTGSPGLPLADLVATEGLYYEDRLDLNPRTYYYTIVPLGGPNGTESGAQTLEVDVARVITL